MGSIILEDAAEMAVVCAALVREGVVFVASSNNGKFVVELTGGY